MDFILITNRAEIITTPPPTIAYRPVDETVVVVDNWRSVNIVVPMQELVIVVIVIGIIVHVVT